MELLISITFIIVGSVWIGILVTAIFGKLISGLFGSRKSYLKWPANGIEAEAIVLKMEPTGLYINKLPQVRLQMQVQPDKGRNFVIEIDTVSPPAVKTGATIKVKYNPRNYKELLMMNVA